MSRDSINLTLTAPLVRANVRKRLDALAARTDLPATEIAARTLLFGLPHIESDWTRLFHGAAVAADGQTSGLAPVVTAHDESVRSDAEQGAAARDDAKQGAAPPPQAAASAYAAEDKPAPASEMNQAPAQRTEQPERVPTKVAAAALGKSPAAFAQHLQRHPQLRRYGRKLAGAMLWDLDRLRAEYERKGSAPR